MTSEAKDECQISPGIAAVFGPTHAPTPNANEDGAGSKRKVNEKPDSTEVSKKLKVTSTRATRKSSKTTSAKALNVESAVEDRDVGTTGSGLLGSAQPSIRGGETRNVVKSIGDASQSTGRQSKREHLGETKTTSSQLNVKISSDNGPPVASKTYLIADLAGAAQSSWKLAARVIARSSPSTFCGMWGGGKKFDIHLVDTNGEVIKATIFNKGVDTFDTAIKTGGTYLFSLGRVKQPNVAYSADCVELTFDEHAVIQETTPIPRGPITWLSIEGVQRTAPGSKVSIIGVVAMVGAVKSMMTKKQNVCFKRDFLVVDCTMRKIVCTRWGKSADEDISDTIGKVVIVRNADVNEYQGMRSLNMGPASSILLDPDVAERSTMQQWYNEGQDLHNFTFI